MSKTYKDNKRDPDARKNGKKIRQEKTKRSRRLDNEFQSLRGKVDYDYIKNLDLDE